MPTIADLQQGQLNGFAIPEAQSGINGVTADTIGNAWCLNGVNASAANIVSPQMFEAFAVQLRTTGTFTLGKLTVEASLDGTNWTEVALLNATSAAAVAAGGFAFTTAAVTLFTNAIDMPMRFARARLSGGTTGGTGAFVAVQVGGF